MDQNEAATQYRYLLQQIQNRFRFLCVEPEDIKHFKKGLTDEDIACDGIVLDEMALRVMQRRRQFEASESLNHPLVPPIDVDVVLSKTRSLIRSTPSTRDDGNPHRKLPRTCSSLNRPTEADAICVKHLPTRH